MIQNYFKETRSCVDKWLDQVLISDTAYPALIHESMRYMAFNGGKRIRPILVIACCEACAGGREAAKIPACAVELIHTYSLIHDDLPCMDNDDERRGQPTCHKKYGEAYAVLAGDALLTYAFELLSQMKSSKISLRMIRELASAAGSTGMVGGQVVDKLSEGGDYTVPLLDYINIHKTGKLIMVSCLLGALTAGASAKIEKQIVRYGEYLGFAFQVVDDIIDGDGYVRFIGPHRSYERAEELIGKAKEAVLSLGDRAQYLCAIADFVLERGMKHNAKK